jgi:hypothetical protein
MALCVHPARCNAGKRDLGGTGCEVLPNGAHRRAGAGVEILDTDRFDRER